MTQPKFSSQELQELRELAARWGKIVAKHAFGEQGPGLDVDFATLEQIAQAAATGLTEGTLLTLLEQQAQSLGNPQPCPLCGRPCTTRRSDRPLTVAGGTQLTHSELVC